MKYGQTWWGAEWLKALSHIDFSNRLPRGRTYANKGSVKNLTVQGHAIYAKVQGTRKTPYDISIRVPAFTTEEKDILTQAILNNPLLLSRLLNRELPESLHKIATSNNIRIFPRKWNDLQMYCSCPDGAVPCKHLAAVIYMVSNEIDRNPFVIFKLHEFDIIRELNKKGLEAIRETVEIPSTADFILPSEKEASGIISSLETIDFSMIDEMREKTLTLLSDAPLFYPQNFKSVIDQIYKKTARASIRELRNTMPSGDENQINYDKHSDIRMILWKETQFGQAYLHMGNEETIFHNPQEMIQFLSLIPVKYINRLSPELVLFYFVFHFSQRLAEKSAFIPQLLQLSDASYTIRWIPTLINEEVRFIFDQLTSACPSKLLSLENSNKIINPSEQVKILTSIFLAYYINSGNGLTRMVTDPVLRLFSGEFLYKFNKLGEYEIPATIQRWIDKLYLTHQKYTPVLAVSEDEKTRLFHVNILVENTETPFVAPIPLMDILNEPKNEKVKVEILRNLDLLTKSFPEIEDVITSSGRIIPQFFPDEFAHVLLNIIPLIKLYGIKIILPYELKNLVRPKVSMSISSGSSTKSKSFLNLDEILNFEWKIALGDSLFSREEFLKLVQGVSGIVKIKQQYVHLDPNDLKALMDSLNMQEKPDRNQLLQATISGEYQGAKIRMDKNTQQLLDSLIKSTTIDLPEELNATLRPYQQRGFDWLYKNTQLGFGSIIADDMGLGKTVQVITMLLKLKSEGQLSKQKALVIVPTTLLTNWQHEFDKFAPTLTYFIFHGVKRKLNTDVDVVITSYGVTRSDSTILSKHKWKTVVIDEAQNIKNASTAQTKAVKKLKSDIRIAMSGTPVENRLSEYWSIFDFTNKGYLGNAKKFKEEFTNPIEIYRDKEKLQRFLKITSPFILRRLKSDKSIITDLPEKIENDYMVSLAKEQTAIYQNVLDTIMAEIEQVNNAETNGNIQRRGLVLKLIMALKQICNHPSQFLKKKLSSPELSGKATLLMDLVENIMEGNEKIIIFTQFQQMGILLQKMIKERFDMDTLFLHGGTTRKNRDDMVHRFQNDIHEKILILSIKAGGTGLNLTAANHVIHYDLWWNPAVEAQATDRAYRIGQNKNVMVYRLITKGTFEEKINLMLQSKKELANLTVSTGEKWIGELPNTELKELFSLGEN